MYAGGRHNSSAPGPGIRRHVHCKLNAEVVLVAPGTPEAIDKIQVYQRLMDMNGQNLKGVILNKCDDPKVKKLVESRNDRSWLHTFG